LFFFWLLQEISFLPPLSWSNLSHFRCTGHLSQGFFHPQLLIACAQIGAVRFILIVLSSHLFDFYLPPSFPTRALLFLLFFFFSLTTLDLKRRLQPGHREKTPHTTFFFFFSSKLFRFTFPFLPRFHNLCLPHAFPVRTLSLLLFSCH